MHLLLGRLLENENLKKKEDASFMLAWYAIIISCVCSSVCLSVCLSQAEAVVLSKWLNINVIRNQRRMIAIATPIFRRQRYFKILMGSP